MPKLVITATGDEFFPPDNANFFYRNLSQPTFLQMWENDDHTLTAHMNQVDDSAQSFFLNVYRGLPFPKFNWTRFEDATGGTIIVTTTTPPLTITSWWTDTTIVTCEPLRNFICRRDFRIFTPSAILWREKPVQKIDANTYKANFLKRKDFGYRIFYVKLTFPGPDAFTFSFTTDVQVIPDTYPYEKCKTEEECKGRLI